MDESLFSLAIKDINTYVKENPGTAALATGSGGIIGWWLAKSVTGVVLGGIVGPLVVAYGVTKFTGKAA